MDPVEEAASGYLPGTAPYRRVVGALFAAGLATFSLLYSTQALLPRLSAHFEVSTASSTLSLSFTTLGLGVALLVAGPISDVTGRTRLIHASLAASAAVAFACAFAPSWSALLVLRLLEGIVLAGLPAVATAYLREELDPSAHGRAAGLYIGGTALGGMAGRLLTGGVAEVAGWRWALVASAALGLACAVAVRALLPASRRFTPAPTGLRALVDAGRRSLSDPALPALFAVGGCSVGALAGVLNTVGFRLEAPPFGLGIGAASLVFLVYPLGSLSSTLFGRLADARGRRAVLPAGSLLAVIGCLLTLPAALPTLVGGLALIMIGFFAVHGVASGWVPVRAHAAGVPTGLAASLYLVAFYLGSSVFGTIGGQLWSSAGWPGTITLVSLLFLTTGGLALALRRTPTLLRTADATLR